MKKISLLILSIFFLCKTGLSQQYNFHNYSVKEGLAQSQVYSILQDSRGYLWMGTLGGGLSQYDGLSFNSLTVKNGLINNYVYCIKEDKNQNLWIGTNNGISKYNGLSFENFQPPNNSVPLKIEEIAIDNKERKWLATNNGVVLMENGRFINISDLMNEEKTIINAICIDKSGTVWYGNEKGLFRITEKALETNSLKFNKSERVFKNSITRIKEDKKGNIWIGTYQDGVYVFDGQKISRFVNNSLLNRQIIFDIYFDTHENVWFATLLNGVAEFNTLSGTLTWLTDKEGLSSNHAKCIIQDNSENYWIGTSGGGVCNYLGKQFTSYDKSSGLSGNFIHSIFRDSQNRLWIGTSDKGLCLFDSMGFHAYNSENGFFDVKVKAMIEDNNGKVYFGTDGQGVFELFENEFKPLTALKGKFIRSMVKDKLGNLWFATLGTGIYKLTLTGKGNKLERFTSNNGLLHNRVTCLHYDKQGRLWYGTENNGVGYIENDVIQPDIISRKEGLPSNSISCIVEDESGYLWIGTTGYGIAGIPLYQGNFNIKVYDHTKGLTSSNVYLMTIDNKNNLFVGTETGLDYIVMDEERNPVEIKHYSKGEGFTGIETCINSVFRDSTGTIWFGTINGLSRYNPANRVKNENEPITNIDNVNLFYVPISKTPYKNFASNWNQIAYIDLPYTQNHLTFDFSAINLSNPEAVRYQWKLEGFDKEWSPVSKNHSILYSNLPPGNYSFLVKACNEDDVWNKEPVKLNFHISSPFWMKLWFIILVILVIAGIAFTLFKWRVHRIKKMSAEEQKKLQLEKEVVELEQKALRLQMNPHFIFNAINSIQSQIGNDNDQVARYYLAKFARLMRQILDNSKHARISLEDEVGTLENYLLIEKFCNDDKFDYKIVIEPNIEIDFIKVPPMLLQPFIENAVKHGIKHLSNKNGESQRGMIEVEFKEIENILECSVTDNGIGRAKSEELNKSRKETYHKSTALVVTQKRLDLLKTDENFLSFEIVDLYDEQGMPSGTKVILRLPVE